MANIKDLKSKIKSTKGTLKITSAMKLVSAAKLARAQLAITSSRPYANELETSIKTISALVQNFSHPFLEETENKKCVLLVVSSNKGLCAGFNTQIIKEVRRWIKGTDLDPKIYFVGKKAMDIIASEVNVGKKFEFNKADPTFLEVTNLAEELADLFKTGEIGKVFVAYNVFNSAISFTPTVKQLLPMSLNEEEKASVKKDFPFDFKYEPSPESILNELIPQTFITTLYTSILDAAAAEHGSRMSAMDSAARNCKDAIRTLTIKMNKLRQAAITTELIEVVSGAESLKG